MRAALAQPAGDDRAGGSRADDDVVMGRVFFISISLDPKGSSLRGR